MSLYLLPHPVQGMHGARAVPHSPLMPGSVAATSRLRVHQQQPAPLLRAHWQLAGQHRLHQQLQLARLPGCRPWHRQPHRTVLAAMCQPQELRLRRLRPVAPCALAEHAEAGSPPGRKGPAQREAEGELLNVGAILPPELRGCQALHLRWRGCHAARIQHLRRRM